MMVGHLDTRMRDRLLHEIGAQSRPVDIGGVATSVLETGEGPPLVLLHGGIQCGGVIWWRAVPRLAERFRLIIPDLPGLGESEPAAERLDASTVGRWLEALVEKICEEEPTLVAHSAPGALAARFAVEHGDQLRRLVLVDPVGLGRFRPSPGLLVALVRSSVRPSRGGFEHLMSRVMDDAERVRQDAGEQWRALSGYVASRAGGPAVKRAMRQLVKSGTTAIPDGDLQRIVVPTVLVWGRHDGLIPRRVGERASATLGWPLHVVDHAGHLPHVEQPDRFVDVVMAATAGR